MAGVEFYSEDEGGQQGHNAPYQRVPVPIKPPLSKKRQFIAMIFVGIAIAVSVFVFLKYTVLKKNINYVDSYRNVDQKNFIPTKPEQ